MGRRAIILAAVTAALVLPSSALAAVGRLENGVMIYEAAAGESNTVTFNVGTDPFNPIFEVVDQPSVSITPTPPCFNENGQQNAMACPQDGGGTGQVVLFQASLGDGNDTVNLLANLPTSIGAGGGQDTMNGGPAADFLRGGQGGDKIDGGAGNDQIVGDDPGVDTGGDDALSGGAGNDTIDGQNGNDTITSAVADGSDVDNGGAGTDTMTFAGRTAGVNVSLDGQANDGEGGENDNVQTDVENVTGGSAGDTISGSDAGNALDGGAGGDTLNGAGGPDALVGGPGDDSESGGDDGDLVSGGDGDDAIFGDAGDDQLQGDAGNDPIQGGDGADALDGGSGDDALDGSAGPDVMVGGDGTDKTNYANRTEPLTITIDGNANDGAAGEGDNVQTDVEDILSGAGADTLIGSAAANRIDGGQGENYEDGGAGGDSLIGGDSGDVLRTRGSAEGDAITCGPGPDFVIAKPADTVSPDCDRTDRGVNQKPKLRDSAVVAPVRGALQMSPTGIVRRVPLQDTVVLPLRSVVDTVVGAVKVTSSATSRKTQSIALEQGAFDITQTAAKLAVTQFALQGGDFSVCPVPRPAGRAAHDSAAAKTVRNLWASGKGSFRTKGRYAAATVRGTNWQTVDRCDGTLIRVKTGAVTVRDLVKKKTVVVKAGKTYLAKAG